MKYNVNVKDNAISVDYVISVYEHNLEESHSNNDQNKSSNKDPNLCYQIALAEYEHSIKRMERLDNKIYILLTVCAFIFILLTNIIDVFDDISLPHGEIDIILIRSYIIGSIFSILLFSILLIKLVKSLSSVKMNRFDSFQLIKRKMYLADSSQVAGYVIAKMEKARNDNNKLIDEKYKCVDCCVKILIALILVLIFMSLLGCFVPKIINDVEPKFIDQILETENYDLRE